MKTDKDVFDYFNRQPTKVDLAMDFFVACYLFALGLGTGYALWGIK